MSSTYFTDIATFVSASNTMKCDLFSIPVTANTDILTQDISFSVQPVSLGFIYIVPVGAGSLTVTWNRYGQTVTGTFAAESANYPNWHQIEVSWKETVNFQYSATTTLSKFIVAEIVPQTSSS